MGTLTHEPAGFTLSLDYDINDNLIYFGRAAKGTSEATAGWTIAKLIYDANQNLINIQWAGGNNRFVHVWDDRTSLVYS